MGERRPHGNIGKPAGLAVALLLAVAYAVGAVRGTRIEALRAREGTVELAVPAGVEPCAWSLEREGDTLELVRLERRAGKWVAVYDPLRR